MSFISGTVNTGGALNTISKNVPNCIRLNALHGAFYRCTSSGVTTGGPNIPSPTGPTGGGVQYDVSERGCFYFPSPAQFDMWRAYAFIPAGTYRVRFDTSYYIDRGILSLYVDGTLSGTLDLYVATTPAGNYTRYKNDTLSRVPISSITSSLVISTTGIKRIELRMDTKNAASGYYYLPMRDLFFIRTA